MDSSELKKRYPNLKPFVKGDPRRCTNGWHINKLHSVRRKLEKLDAQAIATLRRLLNSDDIEWMVEGLKFWGKYRLPVPKDEDKAAIAAKEKIEKLPLKDELVAKLAELKPEDFKEMDS